MVWFIFSCRHDSARPSSRRAAKKPLPLKQYFSLAAVWLSLALCLAPQAARAQIGVGFTDNGQYQGTVGANKGAVMGYKCPNGGVIRGFRHTDKQTPYPPMTSASGMTIQIDLYCNLVTLDKDKQARAYPTTPDGTPALIGGGNYRGAGVVQEAYCNADSVVTRVGGDYRKSTNTYPAWASDIRWVCRGIEVLPGDWVAVKTAGYHERGAGIHEDWMWPHYWTGYICGEAKDRAVNGIFRQDGGEGWDGYNIYCATVRQARFSARLEFQHFAWKKTLGPDGWLTDLKKDGKLLEQQIYDKESGGYATISGKDKRPYSSIEGTDNDPNDFQYDYELYVLPGKGYGADLSHRPEDIPAKSYIASSTCISQVQLQDKEDKTCDLYVVGRPDIGVSIDIPQNVFIDIGAKHDVTLKAVNYGATDATAAAGFTLEAEIPAGWTAEAVPGCAVSGQKVSCAISKDLANAEEYGKEGGAVSFTFPIAANDNAQPGSFDVPLKLGRESADATNLPQNSDYETENDTAKAVITFARRPTLQVLKTSQDGTGIFNFSGDNGWQSEDIATEAPSLEKAGKIQILTTPQQATTITETAPRGTADPVFGWSIQKADCTGMGEGGAAVFDKATSSIAFDEKATDYNSDIVCKVVNQLYTTRTTKTPFPFNNAPVQSDDEIAYTISTQVVGDTTTEDTVLSDLIGDSAEFIEMTDAGPFTIDDSAAPNLKFILPKGTEVGAYNLSYKVRVRKDAKEAVKNTIHSNNGYCDACETQNPLVQIATVKKSDIGDGNTIGADDTVTYTLRTTITGGAAVKPVVLTDSLSEDLEFISIAGGSGFQADTSDPHRLKFTLPQDTPEGAYEVSYKVKVKTEATGTVANSVEASAGTCAQCATKNDVVAVRINKSSDYGTDEQVQNSDIITYKLLVKVTGGYSIHDTVLTDTLSDGLEFRSVADGGKFTADTSAAPKLKFTLPKGTPPGTYAVTYKAKIGDDAHGTVKNNVQSENGLCETCATQNPVTHISTDKVSDPAAGVPLQRGDSVTYTATVHIEDGSTTAPVALNDTLGDGLAFEAITDKGKFTAVTRNAPKLTFTLPKGTPPGDYPIRYRAKVKKDAAGKVANAIIPEAGKCEKCGTESPVVGVNTVKTSDIEAGRGLQRGDTVTYTLTTTVTGGATTKDTLLTDTLGDGLNFAAVADAGAYRAETDGAPELKFTLPKGAQPGTYKISYTAKVAEDAADSLTNSVTSSKGAECPSCHIDIPLVNIASQKTSDVGSGAPVQQGDIITYTLTTKIDNAPATHDIVLTDALGDSLDFVGLKGDSAFQAQTGDPKAMRFTLPQGTKPGIYTVSYQAKVKLSATLAAGNKMTADNGTCEPCETQNPLVFLNTVKTADPKDKAVQRGDIITYTLATTVTGGATTQDLLLTDRLGDSLAFGKVNFSASNRFKADTDSAPELRFTLPKGTKPGTYSVSYTAAVKDDAAADAGNNVSADHGSCAQCGTKNPLVKSDTVKTSDIGAGSSAERGDIITYTLATTITGGATTQPITLSDALDPNLEFVEVTDKGAFTVSGGTPAAPVRNFILPAGTAAGEYKIRYTARVKDSAQKAVSNKVTSSYGECSACTTTNPVVDYSTKKSSNVAANAAVQVGDTIIYTLTTTVEGGATTNPMILTDTLGSGLSFAKLVKTEPFTADTSAAPALKFTLPKGTPAGAYTASYAATVNQDAAGALKNTVVPSSGSSTDTTTSAPLVTLSTAKTASPASGAPMQRGDTVTYTLTATVKGGATTQDTVLTDTLGSGLVFNSVTQAGSFKADVSGAPKLLFTLPKGAKAGSYSTSYTVKIGDNAADKIGNSVVPNNGECPQCTTEHPMIDISTVKKADPEDKAVQVGDTIIYTVNATITGGVSTQDLVLTDTLGSGLKFGRVLSAGKYKADAAQAPKLTFTLPKGTRAGTYPIRYMATVTDTSGDTVANNLQSNYGSCAECVSKNPVVSLDTVKTANIPNGAYVQKGDILTYTLTTTVKGGETTQPLVLTDTLGQGLIFDGIDSSGDFTAKTTAAPKLSFTLPKGKPAGVYTVTYRAKVAENAAKPLQNAVTADKGTCSSCALKNPLIGINTEKSADIDTAGVEPGDTITYTLTTTVTGGQTTKALVLTDTLGDNLTFAGQAGASPFTLDASAPQQPKFTLAAGQQPGVYKVSYKAKVKEGGAGFAENTLTTDNGSCDPCSVKNPIIAYKTKKSADNGTDAVQIGDEITYTIATTVSGGTSTQPLLLNDVLGTGLEFVAVEDAGNFEADVANKQNPQFTLPKGTPEGTYQLAYRAKVTGQAVGAAENNISANKGVCDPCKAVNPLLTIAAAKASAPKSGTAVQKGDTVSYTLTVNIVGGITSQDTVLTDSLGGSLEFDEVTDAGDFTADTSDPQALKFTLPAGSIDGTHSLTYTAKVKENAAMAAQNKVVPQSVDSSGTPVKDAPIVCEPCGTENPLVGISTEKTSAPTGPVQPGDTITYTLTTTIEGGATSQDVVLTDTLGKSLRFAAADAESDFTVNSRNAPVLQFTLPKGAAEGKHSVSYTVKVADSAAEDAQNAVQANSGSCERCATKNPLVQVKAAKSVNVGAGSPVQSGDTLTYTLTATITGGASTKPAILSDTIGAGLEFLALGKNDGFTAETSAPPKLSFTLPAGKPAGTYAVSYTARVKADATIAADNTVTARTPDNSPLPCETCKTENPLVSIATSKAVSPAGAVQKGDTLTYTLTVLVKGGKTTRATTLTDTLGTGLAQAALKDKGAFTADFSAPQTPKFTLPAGTPAGTYKVSYTAKVADNAEAAVKNNVVSDSGTCAPCSVQNPLSTTATAKTSDVGDGAFVQKGDVITYRLTTTVIGGATSQPTVLTDTLGKDLQFVDIVDAGAFAPDTGNKQTPKFTLPAGTPAGAYSVSYRARVKADAGGDVGNAVQSSSGSCEPCATKNPLVGLVSAKSSAPPAGSSVQKGDTITYTLTTTVSGGKTTKPTVLTDASGSGLQFKAVTDSGRFTADVSNPQALVFTLPSGTEPGTYAVSFTADVVKDSGQAVKNTLTADNGSCDSCQTSHPISHIAVGKSSDKGSLAVQKGDTITYSLNVAVKDAPSTQEVHLTDTLSPNVDFTAITDGGAFTTDTSGAPALKFTLPKGKPVGTYTVSYAVKIKDNLNDNDIIKNAVTTDIGTCQPCSITNPMLGINSQKSAGPAAGEPVDKGQIVTYTVKTQVTGGAVKQDYILTDALGESLQDFSVKSASPQYKVDSSNPQAPKFTLPAGTAEGEYTVTYTAKVKDNAEKSAQNALTPNQGVCEPCATKHPIRGVASNKTVDAGNNTPIQQGDTLTYTLTTKLTGGAAKKDIILTDTLGAGLEFAGLVPDGSAFTADTSKAPVLKFTLPQGTAEGAAYTVSYKAKVKTDAAATVGNSLTASEGTCDECNTYNPLVSVSAAKSSDQANQAVQAGDSIIYSLTATVSGGATTRDTILTDDLGANLSFAAVVSTGEFTLNAADPAKPQFILPAGTPAGSYKVSYRATVKDGAAGTVKNSVIAQPADDSGKPMEGKTFPCEPCAVSNPQLGLSTKKQVVPANGTAVQNGDILTYTLITAVEGGQTTRNTVLTDNLSPGLTFLNIVDGSDFTADTSGAPALKFTLPKGAKQGPHSVSYRVKIKPDTAFAIRNTVIADSGSCDDCSTENPLAKITAAKAAVPPSGSAVQAGDTIIYTLTAAIEGGASSQAVRLGDTLSDDLTFGAVTDAGKFTADTSNPQQPKFTLPAGTAEGVYSVSYTAKVKTNAKIGADNKIVPQALDNSNTPIEDAKIPCDPCETKNPLIGVSAAKTSDVGDGAFVQKGDIITYTLTASVSGGATTQATLLTDSLSDELEFAAVKDAGKFTADTSNPKALKFTLPKDTAEGSYAVSYTARVKTNAKTAAKNTVKAQPVDDSGKPNEGTELPCKPCTTENPLVSLKIAKTANPPAGSGVQKGDTIAYTLSVTVTGGATTQATLLTDTLGDDLEFGALKDKGDFLADTAVAKTPQFTLPAGAAPGIHSVTYTAKVKTNAKIGADNKIVPQALDNSNTPIDGVEIPCDPCETKNPLIGVSAAKTSDVGDGTAVQQGDIITYTLTATVAGGATTQATLLTDSLSDELEFAAVKDAGKFTADTSNPKALKFTLPKDTAAGSYKISYTARVKTNAKTAAKNTVKAQPVDDSGKPNEGTELPCKPCATENPLVSLKIAKAANPPAGSSVQQGDIITYTLTATVTGGKTTQATLLTDSLSDSLAFAAVTDAGKFTADTANPKALKFTLPKGAPAGAYAVSYTAKVKNNAAKDAQNSVTPQALDDSGKPITDVTIPCEPCATKNPLVILAVHKKSDIGDGTPVQKGDYINYTITAEAHGGGTTRSMLLIDTGESLDFVEVTDKGRFETDASDPKNLKFSLPAGTPAGAYDVSYQARVKADAVKSAKNSIVPLVLDENNKPIDDITVPCTPCSTENPLIGTAAGKHSVPASGAAVQKGDTVTYTLNVDVTGGKTTQATRLTDTPDDSLEFGALGQNDGFDADISDVKNLKFTLPKGAAQGSYKVSYTARVKTNATLGAHNKIVPQAVDDSGKPTPGVTVPCDPCETKNPLIGISAAKSSDVGAGTPVQRGDIITYTLTATVAGGASTRATLLTDSLSDSLEFVGIAQAGDFKADAANPKQLKFTLPANAAAGQHSVSYQARVKAAAVTAAQNDVIAQAVDDSGKPIEDITIPCAPCETQNPLIGISNSKTANPPSGSPVQAGDTVTYTLATAIKGGVSSQAVLLTDSLGESLDFGAITDKGAFTADTTDPKHPKFTLPKGMAEGVYTVSYTAKVKTAATTAAENTVVPQALDKSGKPIKDITLPCEPCATKNPLIIVRSAKTAEPKSGTPVQKGDTITYTLTSAVEGGASSQATLLTDSVGESLEFVRIVQNDGFTADTANPQQLKFTLPKGASQGAHSVSYTVRVKVDAVLDAQNTVTPQMLDDSGKPVAGVTPPCRPCATQHPLIGITAAKTSDIGSGAAVQQGDTITYSLSVTVKGGKTTQPTLLSDSLNDSLEFGAVTQAGDFTVSLSDPKNPSFLLPKDAAEGVHTVSYTARVKKDAVLTAKNTAAAHPADEQGKPVQDAPPLPCKPCETENPLIALKGEKSSDIGSGTPVQKGDTITYTLKVTVKGGKTTQPTVLTDSLNDSLQFGSVIKAGDFTADTTDPKKLSFLLPKGALVGVHTVSYTARAKTDAAANAENSVTAAPADNQGKPIEGENAPKIPCEPCETENPLVGITAAKTSNIGNGVSVQSGQVLTYTLTVTVQGGKTTQNTLLTDTVGDSLEFVAVKDAGRFTADTANPKALKFTLPKGAAEGTYSVSYTARVKKNATLDAQNKIAPQAVDDSGKPIDGVEIPCAPCETQNPISRLSVRKASDIGSGAPVQKGDTITYTLTAAVDGSATLNPIVLTDSLNDSLVFDKITDAGVFQADTAAAPKLKFTLPKNTPEGSYSVSYTAKVKTDAVRDAQNTVVPQAVDDSGKPIEGVEIPCQPCATQNPLIGLSAAKSSDVGDSAPVQQGDILTYTLNVEVKGGKTTQAALLTDTLGASLEFVKITQAGDFKTDDSALPMLKFLLPEGAAQGSHKVSYQARVKHDAQNAAQNTASAQPADSAGNPIEGENAPKIPCEPCTTQNPLIGIAAAKSSDIGTGTPVQQGDIITYTLNASVSGGATTQPTLLTDTLGDSLEFVSFDTIGDFKADQTALPMLKFLLPKGAAQGDHKVSYKARVKKTAADPAENSVTAAPADAQGKPIVGENAPKIPCAPCATQNPLISIETAKTSDIGTGNPVQAGQTVTYRLSTIISGGATTQNTLLTDTLGKNVSFAAVKEAGKFTPDSSKAPLITFTLPKGTPPGTYETTYQVKVKDNATKGVADNSVISQPADAQGKPIAGILLPCDPCATQNPLVGIATAKSSDVGSGKPVQQGDTITYTLTTTVSGGVTTADTHLTDTLDNNLQFGQIVNAGVFKAETGGAPALKFTLPAGTAPGEYKILYAAKVKNTATDKVANKVVADNGSCEPCETQNPLISMAVRKSSNIGSGKSVQIGDVITYTLALEVKNGVTTQNTLLTDTLGDSVDFMAVKDGTPFTATIMDKKHLKFLLPAGQKPGLYTVSYTARVRADSKMPAENTATAQAADKDGIPITGENAPKIPCEPCHTENPLASVFIQKSSDKTDADGKSQSVQPGDLITYTLNASVSGGATSRPTLLTDTLNDSLEFVKLVDGGIFKVDTSAAPVLKFILPKGAAAKNDTYSVLYQARVKKAAKADAQNVVTAQAADDAGKPLTGPDAPQVPCRPCSTTNPLVGVFISKSSDIGDGAYVQRGDTITYRLKVKVTGGATGKAILLTDTMNDSLEYVGTVNCDTAFPQAKARALMLSAPQPKAQPEPQPGGKTARVSVPAGTPAGDSRYCYQARVAKDAKITAKNTVEPHYVDEQGKPITDPNVPPIPCEPCSTQNPLAGIALSKSSDVGSGTAVQRGDLITYSVKIEVKGGATTRLINLTDTLGPNLEFVEAVRDNTVTYDPNSPIPKLNFTAYPGLQPGSYTVSYKARVKTDAADFADNTVTGETQAMDSNGKPVPDSALPISDCEPCATKNPIINLSAAKSSDIGSGTPVQKGDLITYTLTATVENGKTTQPMTLEDTLNPSLEFVAVKNKGDYTAVTSGSPLKFTLPKGAAAGKHSVSYTARVKADATITAENTVAPKFADADGNPPKDADGSPIPADKLPPIPCAPCATQNPLINIENSKTAAPAPGTPVQKGDLITYTLTAKVESGPTAHAVLLTDTLNDSLESVTVTDAGGFKADTANPKTLKFILPSGAATGSYSLTYTARVKTNAAAPAQNTVIANSANNDGTPPKDSSGKPLPNTALPCDPCATQHPLIGVAAAKSSDVGSGAYVQRGDIITYSLKMTVAGGATTQASQLTDTLGSNIDFVSVKDAGKFTADTSAAPKLKFTLPKGTADGEYTVSYTARVKKDAQAAADNTVIAEPLDDSGKPITGPNAPHIDCSPCATRNPLSEVMASKVPDIKNDTPVELGDEITYTIEVDVVGGPTTQPTVLLDGLDPTQEFGSVKDAGKFTTADTNDPKNMRFVLPAGTPPGKYKLTYTAKVKSTAQKQVDSQMKAYPGDKDGNPLTGPDAPTVPCQPCATQHPINDEVTLDKKLIAEDGLVTDSAEPNEVLTYEITLTNHGAARADYAAQDVLDNNVSFVEADKDGSHSGGDKGGIVDWKGLSLPARQETGGEFQNGELKLTVKTKVLAPIDEKAQTVFNFVKETGAPDPECVKMRGSQAAPTPAVADTPERAAAKPGNQCVAVPLAKPKLSLKKTASYEDLDGNGSASAGDVIHFTFTLSNDGSVPLENISVEDKGPSFNNVPATNSLSAFTPERVDLAVGAKADVKADYILSEADVQSSSGVPDAVVNKAVAKGRVKTAAGGGDDDPGLAVTSNEDTAKLTLAPPKRELSIGKTVAIRAIRRGEQAPYTIRVTNNGTAAVNDARVVDTAPSGFRFVDGSASVDSKEAKPKLEGRNVVFENLTIAPQQTVEIRLNMLALSSATPGEYVNRAHVEDAMGSRLTDDAKAVVEILVEHVFDCGDVIGTVFDDYNRNGYQDEGEHGLPGVRLATAKGWIIGTDTFGRFHIPCAALPDSRIGSNFILKLDPRSLPSGYRLTTENPRVVRLTAGKLTKINFGASVSRVVRLDLRGDAFETDNVALKQEWNTGLAELIQVLDKEQSVLRLSYIDDRADNRLAQARINHVQALIRKIWGQKAGRYRLEIETRVEVSG